MHWNVRLKMYKISADDYKIITWFIISIIDQLISQLINRM